MPRSHIHLHRLNLFLLEAAAIRVIRCMIAKGKTKAAIKARLGKQFSLTRSRIRYLYRKQCVIEPPVYRSIDEHMQLLQSRVIHSEQGSVLI